MSWMRLALVGCLFLAAGCSTPKEDGQQMLQSLVAVLDKSTIVLETIHDQESAQVAGPQLKELARQWSNLHDFDQKFKFSRSTWDQLLNENQEIRNKISDLKVKFTMEYDRVQKLKPKIETAEFEDFDEAFKRFRQN